MLPSIGMRDLSGSTKSDVPTNAADATSIAITSQSEFEPRRSAATSGPEMPLETSLDSETPSERSLKNETPWAPDFPLSSPRSFSSNGSTSEFPNSFSTAPSKEASDEFSNEFPTSLTDSDSFREPTTAANATSGGNTIIIPSPPPAGPSGFTPAMRRFGGSGGASPAAAISPPPSSSFPATSVFLPALLRLGADLSDDPDDREQVVAQGFAHAQAKPAQGRRHRRAGSLDAMLLAKTMAGGQGVTFATVGVDFRTATTGGTNEDAGRHGTTTARSAAAIEAGSMAGGSKKDEMIPEKATSFPATSVSEESSGSGTSSSSSSSRHDPTGFKSFQPVPTAAQPAAGSPKPAVFGSARFSESSGFKGFKSAFLRLGDDLGDDPDDWDWLAGGQQLTWSNPGGPMKGEACRDDDSSVAPAGHFGRLAPPIAAPTTTAAVPTTPALPPRSPKPVAGPGRVEQG
ncbi:unnamed protein product [Closterium sp. NIES-65]|nr:unnamed protein product [Closterium sp. NIES-65]